MIDSAPLLLLATVKNTQDEKKLGRVQVAIPGLKGEVLLPWIRILQTTASKETGHFFLPEVGDQVVVLRGDGNHPDGMVILGSVYNGVNKPLLPPADKNNDIKQIVTRAGKVTFNDKKGEESITVMTKDEKLSVLLDAKAGTVTVTGDKDVILNCATQVTVASPKVVLKPEKGSAVEVGGSVALTLKGSSGITIGDGSSSIAIKGKDVTIEGPTGVTVKSMSIKLGA